MYAWLEAQAVAAGLVLQALVAAVITATAPTAAPSLELRLAGLTARRRASEPVIGRSVDRPGLGTAPPMECESRNDGKEAPKVARDSCPPSRRTPKCGPQTQKEPPSRRFVSGSDGTRTRDLRRDRPAL